MESDSMDMNNRAEDVAKLLTDKDGDVRGGAVLDLVQLGAKEYAKDIAELLKDEDEWVRARAVEALVDLDAREYTKNIANLLEDKARGSAAWALGQLGAKEYAKDIAKLLKDKDQRVRGDAAGALGDLGAREYIEDLAEVFKESYGSAGEMAIRSLVWLGAKEYAEQMASLLKDEIWYYQTRSAAGVVDYIKSLLGSQDNDVRETAEDVLKRCGVDVELMKNEAQAKVERIKDAIEKLKSEYVGERISAIDALAESGGMEYAGEIAKLLEDENNEVRDKAAEMLMQFSAKENEKYENNLELLDASDKDVTEAGRGF